MKIAVVPNNYQDIEEYNKIGANAFIFGLKGYSSGYKVNLSLEEILKIKEKNKNIEIFIAINKNIFNDELKYLEESLVKLDEIKVSGILFYDLSILNIKLKNNLSVPLVWNQTHMVTNYNTCNYYYSKGVEYGILSSEITLDEINEIKAKTEMKLFVNVVGYQTMAYTRRKLLNNFFISNGKEKMKDKYIIKNDGKDYIIEEEQNGNAILNGELLNGSIIVPNLDIEYLILNENNIPKKLFLEVLSCYRKLVDTKDEKYIRKVDSLIGDNRGFFFKKTIYKVKKNG